MSEPDEVEATKAKACVAIAMHATTIQKLAAMISGFIVAIVIAFIRKSIWPLLGGEVVSYVVSYLVRLSCCHRVRRAAGLPRVAQDHILALFA